MSVTAFTTVIGVLIVVFIILAIFFEHLAKDRTTRDTEEKTILLLYKVEGLLEEGKTKKALRLVSRYTSHKAKISDINTLIGLQID